MLAGGTGRLDAEPCPPKGLLSHSCSASGSWHNLLTVELPEPFARRNAMMPDEGKVSPGSAKTIEMSDQAQLNELREQAQMAFEFAKFGFAGTLSGAFGGMV